MPRRTPTSVEITAMVEGHCPDCGERLVPPVWVTPRPTARVASGTCNRHEGDPRRLFVLYLHDDGRYDLLTHRISTDGVGPAQD